MVDKARLKPGKIPLPHPLDTLPTRTICLITCDPQRQVKDAIAHPSFPTNLSSRITKVIGVSKLKARYQPYESKRQLLNEHGIFLADARVVTMLPQILGKIFYKSNKKPVPISLEPYRQANGDSKRIMPKPAAEKLKTIAPPQQIAKEIEKALSCALVHLSPSNNVAVRVGLSSFTAQQVADNVGAVVTGLAERFVPKGWRNVRSVHIKGPNTMALPIWLADELWLEKEDVLDDGEAEAMKVAAGPGGKKRIRRELDKMEDEDAKRVVQSQRSEELEGKRVKKRKVEDADMSKEIKERREKLKEQKRADREEIHGETKAVAVM